LEPLYGVNSEAGAGGDRRLKRHQKHTSGAMSLRAR